MITIIVAKDLQGAIGKAGAIPWDIPEDLEHFKRETLGGAVIMGRLTWESLPVKPLPDRLNIVVSSRLRTDNACVVESFAQAVHEAQCQGYSRIYAIGGSEIYREALKCADRLLVTQVKTIIKEPDTHFPKVDTSEWRLDMRSVIRSDWPHAAVHEYQRVRPLDAERIVSVAICHEGMVFSKESPARHHHVLHALDKDYKLCALTIGIPENQGFLTSTGRFVGRKEAAGIAQEAMQIDEPNWPPELYSEDLW